MIMTMSSAFKALAAVALVGMLSACGATQARDDYYQSVAAAAQAQAAQSEARYRALATVANSGDPGAANSRNHGYRAHSNTHNHSTIHRVRSTELG